MKPGSSKAVSAMLEQAFEELQTGSYKAAVGTFTACLALSPHEANAFRGRGTTHFETKNWGAAQADFHRAKELNPEDPENWIGLGLSLAMDLQIYPAIEVMQELLRQQPDYLRAHLMLGLLHLRHGADQKGRDYLQKALALSPSLQEKQFIESQLNRQRTTTPRDPV
jgi:tetratricopeptide (TPR) repeat protein